MYSLKNRLRVVWILFFTLVLVFPGCQAVDRILPSEEAEYEDFPGERPYVGEDLRDTGFYFLHGDRYLVPVKLSIPWTEGIARSAVERLVASYQSDSLLSGSGLKAPLPPGTRVIGLTIRDGVARIDFSQDFLDTREGMERVVLDAVTYSLTEFETVDQVEILVEGGLLDEFPPGVPLEQPLGRDRGINLEVCGEVEDLRETSRVQVFFCGRGEEGSISYLVPVTRVISPQENLHEAAMQELIKGPLPGSGLYSDLPPGTQVNELRVEDGKAIIDFNQEFMEYGGGASGEENVLNQVSLTMLQFPQVDQVLILVEGEEARFTTRQQPLTGPDSLNYLPL